MKRQIDDTDDEQVRKKARLSLQALSRLSAPELNAVFAEYDGLSVLLANVGRKLLKKAESNADDVLTKREKKALEFANWLKEKEKMLQNVIQFKRTQLDDLQVEEKLPTVRLSSFDSEYVDNDAANELNYGNPVDQRDRLILLCNKAVSKDRDSTRFFVLALKQYCLLRQSFVEKHTEMSAAQIDELLSKN